MSGTTAGIKKKTKKKSDDKVSFCLIKVLEKICMERGIKTGFEETTSS